ncbi:hypothetical protein AwErysi_00900 [Erysipelotrichaceae bacterium]|nr:hypothetical protein AwErysi_00900 [Erysipelotrichaceae bacterium]
MKQIGKKKVLSIIAIILAIGIGFGGFYFGQAQGQSMTIESYQSKVTSLITDVRSNSEKWSDILGGARDGSGGLSFIDFCAPVYAEKIKILGEAFVKAADEFEGLGDAYDTLQEYEAYQQFFTTYREIGTLMIAFSNAARESEYDTALAEIDNIIALYETRPVLY